MDRYLPLSFSEFLTGWVPALAVSVVAAPAVPAIGPVLAAGGFEFPVVSCILGAIGVLAARPLAHKAEAPGGTGRFVLVTAIMMLIVQLWIVESQPGLLFLFVVAIGLGFSGYSLIELMGEQVKGLVKAGFATVRSVFSKKDNSDG